MNNTAPGAYPADMLSALMNETLDQAGEPEPDAVPDALQREVALLRGILDQANVWLDVLDSDGNVVLWNQAAEDISGYTREEVVGHGRIWDWLYPDPVYRQEIVERAASIIGGEAVQDFETTIRTKDGRERVISWYSRDITDSDGDHIGSIALGRDVTRRKQAEEKLEESERRYRAIVEHANDWIWTLDRDGRLTFANRAAQQESGYDLADVMGKDLSTFIHPDDLPHVRDIYERTLQGENSSYRVRIIDSDGATIHLQVTSTPRWRDNEIAGTIAFGRNITEQVALEDRLQESEERYRAIVEQSHDAVAILQDEDILFASNRLCELTGYSQEEIERMNLSDLIHPDDRKHVRDMTRHRLDGQASPSTFQVKLRTGEGDVRHGEVSMAAIFYGGQTAVLASIRDVTERRRIEKRLRDSEQRLRDMLHTSTDWIWEVDTEGTYTFASGRVEGTLGYTPDDLVGMSLFSLMPEDEAQRMRTLFGEKAAAGEPLVDVETRHITSDGNEVVMLTNAVPILDDDGALVGYRGTDKDITRRRQAEDRARRQQKLSHLLLNATHDLALLLDGDGTILTLNEAMAGSLSADPEKIIGMSFEQYVDSSSFDDRVFEERRQKMHEAIQTGQPVQFQDRRQGRWFDTRLYPVSDDSGAVTQIAAFARDITEQKRMERELRESEEKYRELVENQGEGVGIVNSDEVFVFANPAAAEVFGVEAGSLVGQNILDFLPPEQQEKVQEQTEKRKTGKESSYELEIVRPSGEKRVIAATVTPRFDADGGYTGAFGVFRDVTEQRRMQQQLRESERKYRELLEHANSVILRMNPDGTVTYFNERAERFFGYPEEDILGKNVIGTIVPETETSGRDLRSIVNDIINHPDDYVTNENENTRRNGDVVWMTWTNKVLYDDGEVDEILCIGTDITERKQMEDRLREQEQRFRETVNLLPQPYGEFDLEGNAMFLNETCLEMFQYTREDFEEGLNVMQVLHPDDRERAGRNIQNILQGAETEGYEYRFVRKDGTVFPCLVYSRPIQRDGDVIGFKSMLLDITERKQLEQELRESQEKYATLVEQGNDGIMIVQDYKIVYCNQRLLEIGGYTQEDLQGSLVLNFIEPAYTDMVEERYEKRMAGEEVPRMYEIEIKTKDGRSVPVEVNASIIKYRGRPADMAIMRDITERKQMEENLKKNEEKFRSLAENATDGIYQVDENDAFVFVNDVYCKILGYTKEELLGKKYTMILFDKDIPDAKHITLNASEGEVQKGEFTLKTKKGDGVPVYFSMGPRLVDGNKRGFSGIIHDITERKQMEKELRRLSAAVEQSTEGYVITDMEGTVIYANSAVERLYGYTPDELAGKPVFSLNAASADTGAVQRGFMDSGFWSGEVEQRRKDGSTFPALLSLFTVKNEKGEVSSAVASVRDITERKRAQRELEEKQAYLENIINTVADPLFVKDRDHSWILLNDAYCSFMGYSRYELLGKSDYDFFPEEEADVFWEKDEEVFETGQENVNEEKFTDKQGTTHTVITRKKAYTNEKGEQTLVGTIRDITRRKQMEQELEQLSEEQQVLLDTTPAMIFWIDDQGRFVRVNKRLAATMDMTPDELAGASIPDLYPEEQAREYMRDNREVMESGEPKRNVEEPVDTPEGTRWVSTTKVPYRDADGNVVGVIGFSVDITEQKRAEQQLREQKKLARTLLDATHDVALLADVDGTILAVNEAMAEAMDDDREAIVGSHMRDRIGAEAYARRTPKVREVQRAKQPVQFTDEREGRTFSHRFYPVFDERGEVRQVAVFSRDITDRKRAEQQLRENEERYRRLVEASPDSIILVGLNGRILTANDRAAEIHGFASPEAMVGRDSFAYVAPEDRQRARENMHRVLEEGLVENLEYTFLREDGTSFLAEISVAAIYDEQGSPAAFVGVTRDVTEQKRMERELRESEEKFRRLTEQSFDGIFTQNRRGVFTYVSPAVRRIAGYEPEEVEGTFFGRYIRKRDLPKLLKAMVNLMRGHAVQGLRYSIRRKDGTLAMVEVNATPIVKDGKSVGIQGNIRDITERAQAEERYRRLVESSPELIAEGDEEGRFVTANPAMARALGCSPEDIVGRHAAEVLPDTVYRHRMACARKAMENDTIVEMEDEEGGRFYHNIFIPIDLPDGGRHVQLIARDVTLRKKTEQALRESQEKYRELYEFHQGILQHTPVGIITMDADMRIIYENRAMKEMMGVPQGKESRVMGMDIRETPAVQETGMAQQLDMVRQGKKIQGETSYTSVYGKKVYLSYVCSPIMEEDVFAGAVIIISDVTKRKEMNRELRESEAKFRSIFTNAPIGVALVDTDGRPVMSNPALREMLGYSEEELASKPFPEFTHPDDVDKDLALYRETKEGKRDSYSMEKRYICKDDAVVWANLTVSIVRDEDGEPLWAVGMVEDVTERKHAEEERRRQTQLAALGRIAAVVSHELNTPLANIALAADCLASEHGLAGNEELDTIRRAVDNASSIVKQVLGFSRMDRMDVQPVDLASVVGEAVAAVRDTSPGDASVEVSVAPCRMLADEHHLYRAFVNVVKNAVLARESGGDGHHVSVASEASDGEVVVTIADNGVGMDPEVQAQADQPFFTTRPPGEGTGLGLYIARWIVERHGGSIAIESQPGEGTTVTIRLPLREDDI